MSITQDRQGKKESSLDSPLGKWLESLYNFIFIFAIINGLSV